MTIGGTILGEMKDWVVLAIFIVVGSLILLKFRAVTGMGDASGTCSATYVYNYTDYLCHNGTAGGSQTATAAGLPATVSTFVAAIGEPKNWVAIVIIAAVGFGIFAYMKLKK